MHRLLARLFPALSMFRVVPDEGAAAPAEDDRRAALEAAFDAAPSSGSEDASEGEGLVAPKPEEGSAAPSEGRSRDPLGRFAQKDGESPPADAAQQAHQQQVQEQSQANQQALRAPGSWRPEAREAWAAIPPAAQAEIARREADQTRLAQESAQARQFAGEMQQVISPYMPLIQAEGGNPVRAVQSLLQTAAALRMGTPADKAKLVADMVRTYAIDVEMLDTALAGVAPQNRPQDAMLQSVQQMLDQRLAPVTQMLTAAQQRAQQQADQTRATVQTELETFASDPKNEFFEDVRDYMADIMEIAQRRGQEMSLRDAYRQACQLHPDVSKVMLARSTSTSAQSLTERAQRARSAAVSVSGAPIAGPAGEAAPADDSIRAHLEAAMTRVGGIGR